jgi:hypothetical protein
LVVVLVSAVAGSDSVFVSELLVSAVGVSVSALAAGAAIAAVAVESEDPSLSFSTDKRFASERKVPKPGAPTTVRSALRYCFSKPYFCAAWSRMSLR